MRLDESTQVSTWPRGRLGGVEGNTAVSDADRREEQKKLKRTHQRSREDW